MKPLVLIPGGETEVDFIFATGFLAETAIYIRFSEDDDVLVASPMEIDRAKVQSRARVKLDYDEAGYVDHGGYATFADLAARMLRERGLHEARVSPRLAAGYLDTLRGAGVDVEIAWDLFERERRRKTEAEARAIADSQHAAEAAVVSVARELARSEIKDGVLWLDGAPLTSERLYAAAQHALGELGCTCPDMIIAGSPECAMPHYRGTGRLRANEPIIVDIFPSSRATHYFGDLTRTMVVGEVSQEIRKLHAAVVQALDAGEESIAEGVTGAQVHSAVCQVLVDRGYGTSTPGFEGAEGGPKMIHSTGHGVGLEVHESPSLRITFESALVEGDVVTVEPGLYQQGLGGVRVEDTGMVTKTGFQNFTTLTRSLDPRDYL
ncbi:MAG TPA: Xaa-Pro peptidase family protein [Patescibacteria group bacterium]|nr:Xaa-Pro peptidase family protein [Patescibacteria group bacterium]